MFASEKTWYAVYTKSRAEKKVLLELEYQGIEAYLPLQRKLRQWSDRRKWVETPLISGYIFVHITRREYEAVLKTQGVVTYVKFEGQAAKIPEEQIDWIKRMLRQKEIPVELHHKLFKVGDIIEIQAGPMIGIKGTLISIKNKKRVAIQLEQLNLSLIVDIPVNEISKIEA
ncbi:MAG: UpxY family transcription antiterminator [Prolixibacteraceae bacterium]|nr:UpxY family transcription antiterminator [Prolixibacteraceae bacterium]